MSGDPICTSPRRGIDYYGVLGIKKNAHDLEIKKAFRRLALCYNPERLDKNESSGINFSLVAEAYDVLSNPLWRTLYDQYGEEGLKNGVPGPKNYIQPYVYHGEPMRTYREFFGAESPYADLLDILSTSSDLDGCPEARGTKRKEESIFHPLPLSLAEVFYGGYKKMKIQRLVFETEEKIETVLRDKILNIPIKPGLPTGTKIVFPEEGDQGPSKIPADVIFITEDRAHETFKRECSNLLMTARIFLRDALVGTIVNVKTIDERILRVPITSIVTPEYEKTLMGEGLPLPENPQQRGNLIIKFDVEFPVYMPMVSKNYVKKAFNVYGVHKRSTKYTRDSMDRYNGRRNVDDDVSMRKHDDDDLKKLKLFCQH